MLSHSKQLTPRHHQGWALLTREAKGHDSQICPLWSKNTTCVFPKTREQIGLRTSGQDHILDSQHLISDSKLLVYKVSSFELCLPSLFPLHFSNFLDQLLTQLVFGLKFDLCVLILSSLGIYCQNSSSRALWEEQGRRRWLVTHCRKKPHFPFCPMYVKMSKMPYDGERVQQATAVCRSVGVHSISSKDAHWRHSFLWAYGRVLSTFLINPQEGMPVLPSANHFSRVGQVGTFGSCLDHMYQRKIHRDVFNSPWLSCFQSAGLAFVVVYFKIHH